MVVIVVVVVVVVAVVVVVVVVVFTRDSRMLRHGLGVRLFVCPSRC